MGVQFSFDRSFLVRMSQPAFKERVCSGTTGSSTPCFLLGSAGHPYCNNGKSGPLLGEVSFQTLGECKASHFSLEVFSMEGIASLLDEICSLCNASNGKMITTSSGADKTLVRKTEVNENVNFISTVAVVERLLRRLFLTIREMVEQQPCSMSRASLLVQVLLMVNKRISRYPEVVIPMISLPQPLTNVSHFPKEPLLEHTNFPAVNGPPLRPSAIPATLGVKNTPLEEQQFCSFISRLSLFCLSALQELYFFVYYAGLGCELMPSSCGSTYTHGGTIINKKEDSGKQGGSFPEEKESEDS